MMEAAVVLNLKGENIYDWTPANRTAGSLPDSLTLWEVLWKNKDDLSGVAHSHPGYGDTGPSMEDLTTFAALESALADRLDWWITTGDRMVLVRWVGPDELDYAVLPVTQQPPWLYRLRTLSGYGEPYQNQM